MSVDLDISLGEAPGVYGALAEDLSEHGLRMLTHNLLPVGSVLKFWLHLPAAPVLIAAEVRWVQPYSEFSATPPRMGLRFTTLAPDARRALTRFLELATRKVG